MLTLLMVESTNSVFCMNALTTSNPIGMVYQSIHLNSKSSALTDCKMEPANVTIVIKTDTENNNQLVFHKTMVLYNP